MNKQIIYISILLIILASIIQVNSCNSTKLEKSTIETTVETIQKTFRDTIRDTLYIEKYIYIENKNGDSNDSSKSFVNIDGDSIILDFIITNFNDIVIKEKDSIEYNLNVYSKEKIDSIDLELRLKTIMTKDIVTIKDSIWINKTISKTQIREYNNVIGLEYLYNGNNFVIGDYTRYHNRIGFNIGGGIDIKEKTPIIKTGVSIRF